MPCSKSSECTLHIPSLPTCIPSCFPSAYFSLLLWGTSQFLLYMDLMTSISSDTEVRLLPSVPFPWCWGRHGPTCAPHPPITKMIAADLTVAFPAHAPGRKRLHHWEQEQGTGQRHCKEGEGRLWWHPLAWTTQLSDLSFSLHPGPLRWYWWAGVQSSAAPMEGCPVTDSSGGTETLWRLATNSLKWLLLGLLLLIPSWNFRWPSLPTGKLLWAKELISGL